MITDGEKWHYLAVKSLPALLMITGNNNGDFYQLICFRSYTTKNRLKKHKNVCENHDYCYIEMPEEDTKVFKHNHGEKYMTAPFVIYAGLEFLLEKMNTCHNNPEKSSTTKVNKHTPSDYSLFTNCSLDTIKNKLDYYRGKNCMKKFCKNLTEHNYEKKEMIPLTKKEEKRHNKQDVCHICKKGFTADDNNVALNKNYFKIKDHCHYTGQYRCTPRHLQFTISNTKRNSCSIS